MSDDKAIRERLDSFGEDEGAWTINDVGNRCMLRDDIVSFVESELSRALQPREPAPELADAEARLRGWLGALDVIDAKNIADELDRLRVFERAYRIEKKSSELALGAAKEELDRLRAEVADLKSRLYAEQYEADNLVGASHDEVLKLRAEVDRLAKENAELKAKTLEDFVRVLSSEETCQTTELEPAPPPAGSAERTPVDGTCCSCGYSGAEETLCVAREDRTHCEHWWDGPDESAEAGEPAKEPRGP